MDIEYQVPGNKQTNKSTSGKRGKTLGVCTISVVDGLISPGYIYNSGYTKKETAADSMCTSLGWVSGLVSCTICSVTLM